MIYTVSVIITDKIINISMKRGKQWPQLSESVHFKIDLSSFPNIIYIAKSLVDNEENEKNHI